MTKTRVERGNVRGLIESEAGFLGWIFDIHPILLVQRKLHESILRSLY